MSAFLVQTKIICKIVSALSEYLDNNHSLQNKATALGFDVTSPHWQEKFAEDLFKLNCEALHQRYHDSEFPIFHYHPAHASSLIEVYKDLQCFLYQCSEGNVPETKLFKFMQEFSYFLANQIITNLPAYEKSDWG